MLQRRKLLAQALNLGFGTDTTPSDSGGSLVGDKIGIHTFMDVVNVVDCGATGDGATDDTSALNIAFSSGRCVYMPAGTYKVTSSVTPQEGCRIYGDGMGKSVLMLSGSSSNDNIPIISIEADFVKIHDLTIDMRIGSATTVRGIQFDAACTNTLIDNVEFIGSNAAHACFGILIFEQNVTNLRVSHCKFLNVIMPVSKGDTDSSTTTGTVFHSNYLDGCGNGFNINSPLGAWTDFSVTNNYITNVSNILGGWGVGLSGSGVARGTVANNTFTNFPREVIHVESSAHDISIIGNHLTCGTPTIANFGAIQIVAGAADIKVVGNTVNLSANAGSFMYCMNVAPGGGSSPVDITIVGNTFLTNVNSTGVVTSATSGTINANTFRNPDTASKAAYFMDLSAAAGFDIADNVFYNPAALVKIVNANGFGPIRGSRIDGNLTSFAFLNTASGSTAVVFDGFTISRSYTADGVTANVLFPAGSQMDGKIGFRYIQSSTSTCVATASVFYDGTTLSLSNWKVTNGAAISGNTNFYVTGGNVVSQTAATGTSGQGITTFSGVYIP